MPRKPSSSGYRPGGGKGKRVGPRPSTGNRRFNRQEPKGVVYKASANAKVVTTPEFGSTLVISSHENLRVVGTHLRRLLGQGAVTVNGQLRDLWLAPSEKG